MLATTWLCGFNKIQLINTATDLGGNYEIVTENINGKKIDLYIDSEAGVCLKKKKKERKNTSIKFSWSICVYLYY